MKYNGVARKESSYCEIEYSEIEYSEIECSKIECSEKSAVRRV